MTVNNVLGTGKCNAKDMNKNVIEYKDELHLKLELFLKQITKFKLKERKKKKIYCILI
jgi:hypothetical protein